MKVKEITKIIVSTIQSGVYEIIRYLYRLVYWIYLKTVLASGKSKDYQNLAPMCNIDEVDKSETYREALDYATNDDAVENIAVVGPYGSGKSSIINSYIKYAGLAKHQYLIISLSTFVDKKPDIDSPPGEKSDEPINELEASILEQILYSNEEGSHKYTRLKRINVPRTSKSITLFFMLCIFVLSILSVISNAANDIMLEVSKNLLGFLEISFNGVNNIEPIVFRVFLLFLIVVVDIYVLYIIFRQVSTFTKVSLSLSKVQMEFMSSNGESLLDKYIDEIFNFFKHNRYKVVIFEDLDRYNNNDIFERLKRINRILNDGRIDKRKPMKFIYTLGDHMFDDDRFEERTKFFDFVLPIIPIINSSNSFADLKNSLKDFSVEVKISDRLLEDVSYYIDDMRTLKNIANEFITYYKILAVEGDLNYANNLFAFICFKNRYPYDFSQFQKQKGTIYTLIQNVDKHRKNALAKIDREIKAFELRVNNFDSDVSKSLEELDDIYKMYFCKKMANTSLTILLDANRRSTKNYNQAQLIGLKDMDELFGDNRVNIGNTILDKNDRRTMGGSSIDYYQRREIVILNKESELEEVHTILKDLRRKKRDIQYSNMASILKAQIKDQEVMSFQKSYPMLYYFIINSFIGQDYHKYIGHFKEGHMTNDDMTFLAFVKSKQGLPFEAPVNTPKKVMESIVSEDFEVEALLNYQLLSYLAEHRDERLSLILSKHTYNNELILRFISGFWSWSRENKKDETSELVLLQYVYIYYTGFGRYLSENRKSILDQDSKIIDYTIGMLMPDLIKDGESHNASYFYNLVLSHPNLLKIIEYADESGLGELLYNITDDDSKIKHITFFEDKSNDYDQIIESIYDGNMYELTFENVISLVNRYTDNDSKQITLNQFIGLLSIKKLANLQQYISENDGMFVDSIMVNFNEPSKLEEGNLLYALNYIIRNNESVSKFLDAISKDTVISDVLKVIEGSRPILFEKDRIKPNYGNIFGFIAENGIDDSVTRFVIRNSKELGPPDIDEKDWHIDALCTLIGSIDDQVVLETISGHFDAVELDANLFEDDDTLILIVQSGFKVVLNEEFLDRANENDDLMLTYAVFHPESIIESSMAVKLNSQLTRKAYGMMSLKLFLSLFVNQINIRGEDAWEYIDNVVVDFTEEDYLSFIARINKLEKRIDVTIGYLNNKKVNKEFMLELMDAIDEKYKVFNTKKHFSIENQFKIKDLLEIFRESGLINMKVTSTGKLEIWIKKRLFNVKGD